MAGKRPSRPKADADRSDEAEPAAIETDAPSDEMDLRVDDLHDAIENDDVSAADVTEDVATQSAPTDPAHDDEAAPVQPDEGSPEPEELRATQEAGPVEPVRTQTIIERKGGFVSMILGGVVAAGIGFGAAYYMLPDLIGAGSSEFELRTTGQLETQAAEIAALTARLDTLPLPADTTALETAQAATAGALDALNARIAELEARSGEMDTRLTDVEKRPLTEGASDAAVAAYERELTALQDAMAAQRAEIEAMMAEAQSAEANAAQTAQATMRRAALTRIQTALDAGAGFAPALGDLRTTGIEIPPALNAVAEQGVASLTELQDAFPEVARAALAASRRAVAGTDGASGFSSFLKTQLGARSLEPRAGTDPDAILSRAEAAARDGRLSAALAEIETLPEEGRAETTEWVAKVTKRLEAVAAAEALGQELN